MGTGLDNFNKLTAIETKLNEKMDNIRTKLGDFGVSVNQTKNLTTINEDLQKIIMVYPLINDNAKTWESIALPTGVTKLNKVIYEGNKFVAVGNGGMILISENGYRWDIAYNTATADLNNIAYINGLYIAVGKNMTILTSPDALVWTIITAPTISSAPAYDLYGISYDVMADGSIKYIATGGTGIAYAVMISSLNSSTWTEEVPSAAILDTYGRLIKIGNYKYIASINKPVIYDTVATNKVANIDEDAAGTERIVNFAYGNGKVLGVGNNALISNLLDKTDTSVATKWKNIATAQLQYNFSDIIFYNNLFFMVSKNGLGFWSRDGLTWNMITITTEPAYIGLESVCCNGDKYIAVGTRIFISDAYNPIDSKFVDNNALFCDGYGIETKIGKNEKYVGISYDKNIYSSNDLINWNIVSDIPGVESGSIEILDAKCYDGAYLAVGSSGVITTSIDGIHWKLQTMGTADFQSVGYINNMYIATGKNGNIATSTDLATWTVRNIGLISGLPPIITKIHYANGIYVACGYIDSSDFIGFIITSPDLVTWTTRTIPSSFGSTEIVYSVTYGNGLFVAVTQGSPDSILTSPDGITWTMRLTSNGGGAIIDVIYANNLFVAVTEGWSGYIFTSPDGITWTQRYDGDAILFRRLSYLNNQFIATASWGTKVVVSSDGITWTKYDINVDGSDMYAIGCPENNFEYRNAYYGSFIANEQTGAINLKFTPKRVYIISQNKNNAFCKINISSLDDFSVRSVKTKTYTIQQLTDIGTPECIINTGNMVIKNGFKYQLPAQVELYIGMVYNYYAIG